MRVIVTAAVLGVVAGAAATWIVLERGWLPRPAGPVGMRMIDAVPQMSSAEAESHRAARFERLRTIENVLALPGEFAQTEALYALAGRSDSAGVQDLIFQADGIADPSDRKAALEILFSRLTELDPESALVLSTGHFGSQQDIEATVWANWGRLDLDEALRRAAHVDSATQRRRAADALLAAYGYRGNERTERIAATLGLGPADGTRARYLYQLADRDPVQAIRYIHTLPQRAKQHEAAALLGRYLGRHDPARARRFATAFEETYLEEAYRGAVMLESAEAEPRAVLDTLLAGGNRPDALRQAHRAMAVLARQDIDEALAYLDGVHNNQQRDMLGRVVVQALARDDPERALAWAKANDRSTHGALTTHALLAIASEDPALALEQAADLSNPELREQAYSMIAMSLSHSDPQRAVTLLEQIPDEHDRRDVARRVMQRWVQSDPDTALSWMLGNDVGVDDATMARAAQALADSDPDAAIRWLPRIGDRHQPAWRSAIAIGLALQDRSAAERFIARFEHTEDYPQLLATVASGVAQSDLDAAFRMGSQVASDRARDSLYVRLIRQEAMADPQRAAERLHTITDASQRAMAAGQVAGAWSRTDPAAAERWAGALPDDAGRDHAIMYVASQWDELTPVRRRLIDSIGDAATRRQALTNHVFRVANTDARKAEALLNELDFSAEERRRILDTITSIRHGGATFIHR